MKPTPVFLLLPLALASFGLSTWSPQQTSAWRQSQKTDAASGTAYIRFTLAGKFLKSTRGNVPDHPAFVLDCDPGEESHRSKGRFRSGNLVVGTPLKILYIEPEEIHGTSYFPKISIRYRMDDGKEESEKWSPGTDRISAGMEKTTASIPEEALKKILRAHTVEMTADDAHGSPVVMQFDLPDPAPVEEGCGVDEHKK
jgi:hypothetical protein